MAAFKARLEQPSRSQVAASSGGTMRSGSPPPMSPAPPTVPAISIDWAKVCASCAHVPLAESTTSTVPLTPTTVTTLSEAA